MNIINPKNVKKWPFYKALEKMMKGQVMKREGWRKEYCYFDTDPWGGKVLMMNQDCVYIRWTPSSSDLVSEDWIVINHNHIDLSEEVKVANKLYREKYGS